MLTADEKAAAQTATWFGEEWGRMKNGVKHL